MAHGIRIVIREWHAKCLAIFGKTGSQSIATLFKAMPMRARMPAGVPMANELVTVSSCPQSPRAVH